MMTLILPIVILNTINTYGMLDNKDININQVLTDDVIEAALSKNTEFYQYFAKVLHNQKIHICDIVKVKNKPPHSYCSVKKLDHGVKKLDLQVKIAYNDTECVNFYDLVRACYEVDPNSKGFNPFKAKDTLPAQVKEAEWAEFFKNARWVNEIYYQQRMTDIFHK